MAMTRAYTDHTGMACINHPCGLEQHLQVDSPFYSTAQGNKPPVFDLKIPPLRVLQDSDDNNIDYISFLSPTYDDIVDRKKTVFRYCFY